MGAISEGAVFQAAGGLYNHGGGKPTLDTEV